MARWARRSGQQQTGISFDQLARFSGDALAREDGTVKKPRRKLPGVLGWACPLYAGHVTLKQSMCHFLSSTKNHLDAMIS
jgi:hypothetical protein